MAQIMLKLSTIVGENLEIHCSRMAQNALKFSTTWRVPPKILIFPAPWFQPWYIVQNYPQLGGINWPQSLF